MDRIARLPAAERSALFAETAAKMKTTPAVAEKDFWVTWVLELLVDVVAFKQRFYPRGWARYDLAVPGSLRLVPDRAVLAAVEADYRAMTNMIFGTVPAFSEIREMLRALEAEINARR
jgi:hypothetical protein